MKVRIDTPTLGAAFDALNIIQTFREKYPDRILSDTGTTVLEYREIDVPAENLDFFFSFVFAVASGEFWRICLVPDSSA